MAFAKLRKATISFVIRLSVRNSTPTGRILILLNIWVSFWKSVEKIQASLQPDRNNGYFTWRHFHRWQYLAVLLRVGTVSDKSCRENQNTHFLFRPFFRKSCRLWDNVKYFGGARGRRWQYVCKMHAGFVRLHPRKHTPAPMHPYPRTHERKHTQSRARKHTHTSKTYCFFTVTMVMWTCLLVALYVHCLSCYNVIMVIK